MNLTKQAKGGMIRRTKVHRKPLFTTDTFTNTYDALRAGQVPIPGLTVGTPYRNRPITVKDGDPVYVMMAGADPSHTSDYADKIDHRQMPWQQTDENNTLGFRWFDRAQALRAINDLSKKHPVFVTGESYGGRAATDVVAKAERPAAGLVLHDPVSWGDIQAPTNVHTRTLHMRPKYWNEDARDSVIARLGGRKLEVPGAQTQDWYGPDVYDDDKNQQAKFFRQAITDPEKTEASHYWSTASTFRGVQKLKDEYRQQLYGKAQQQLAEGPYSTSLAKNPPQ